MQVGFTMQKALGELFILKSTKPLPILFKSLNWLKFTKQIKKCKPCHPHTISPQHLIPTSQPNCLHNLVF